jgi:hypothetical protein
MDGTGDHNVKQNKLDSKTNTACFLLYVEVKSKENMDLNMVGGAISLYRGRPAGGGKGAEKNWSTLYGHMKRS